MSNATEKILQRQKKANAQLKLKSLQSDVERLRLDISTIEKLSKARGEEPKIDHLRASLRDAEQELEALKAKTSPKRWWEFRK